MMWLQRMHIYHKGTSLLLVYSQHVVLKALAEVAANSHWSKGYLIPSSIILICLLRSPAELTEYWHLSQGYFTSLCLVFIWFLKLLAVNAEYSHLPQSNLTSLCLFLNISGCGCSVFTVSARIYHFFIFTLNMSSKTTWMCCSEITFITRIHYPFMFPLSMFLSGLFTIGSIIFLLMSRGSSLWFTISPLTIYFLCINKCNFCSRPRIRANTIHLQSTS